MPNAPESRRSAAVSSSKENGIAAHAIVMRARDTNKPISREDLVFLDDFLASASRRLPTQTAIDNARFRKLAGRK